MAPSVLLVSLNTGAVLGEITLIRRRKKLHEITNEEDLGAAYAATLSQMKTQPRNRSKIGMDVLMWVSHVEWSLPVNECAMPCG